MPVEFMIKIQEYGSISNSFQFGRNNELPGQNSRYTRHILNRKHLEGRRDQTGLGLHTSQALMYLHVITYM